MSDPLEQFVDQCCSVLEQSSFELVPVSQLLMKFSQNHPDVGFDEIELALRKRNNVRLFLFAEHPKTGKHNRDGIVFKNKTYILGLSTLATREKAVLDFENECGDVVVNLARLKDAHFCIGFPDSAVVAVVDDGVPSLKRTEERIEREATQWELIKIILSESASVFELPLLHFLTILSILKNDDQMWNYWNDNADKLPIIMCRNFIFLAVIVPGNTSRDTLTYYDICCSLFKTLIT